MPSHSAVAPQDAPTSSRLLLLLLLVACTCCSSVAASHVQRFIPGLLQELGLQEVDPLSADAAATALLSATELPSRLQPFCLHCWEREPVPAAVADKPLRLLLATGNRALWYSPGTQQHQVLHEGGVRRGLACMH